MDVVQKISEAAATPEGLVNDRIEIVSVTIRDTPPPEPEPFSTETVEELRAYRAVLDTTAGPITIEFFPDKAPEHVRDFLRLAAAGVLDGTAFHRVVKGFVVQTGFSEHARAADREAAEDRPPAAAGVQRHEARQGHRLDGARRRSGERHDLVLHRAPATPARSTASTPPSAGSSTA